MQHPLNVGVACYAQCAYSNHIDNATGAAQMTTTITRGDIVKVQRSESKVYGQVRGIAGDKVQVMTDAGHLIVAKSSAVTFVKKPAASK